MLSQKTLDNLLEMTKESDIDNAVQKLIKNFIDTKFAYWQLLNKYFEEKKGMSFQKYQDTKYKEWDGNNWEKIEEFHDWDDAITGMKYYQELKNNGYC